MLSACATSDLMCSCDRSFSLSRISSRIPLFCSLDLPACFRRGSLTDCICRCALLDSRSGMAKPLGKTGEFFKRRDEWRKHPMLTNQLRHATPGLGIAIVAFGVYLVGEAAYNHLHRSDSPSHSHSH